MSEETAPTGQEPKPEATEPEAKSKGLGSTALRFASALPLVPLIIWLMFMERAWPFQVFGGIWIAICANELMNMALPGEGQKLSRAWGTLSTLGVTLTMFLAPQWIVVALLGSLFVTLPIVIRESQPIETAAQRVGWILGANIYVGVPLGTLSQTQQMEHGGAWVLLSMFVAFLSDTGAYFAGRFFGKHKLSPTLSPKKTWEGSIGGLFAAAGGAIALQYFLLPHVPMWHVAILAPVAAAFGQAGDLLESMLKRSCGVKDSGKIMPGHGGLLDRSDALIFTCSAVYLYLVLVPLAG